MAEMKGNVAVTFDIKPMVTIPLEEYKELKRRAEAGDAMFRTYYGDMMETRRKISDIYHGGRREETF